MIKRLVPDYAGRDVYICGPQPMMDGIVTDLTATDLPTEQLHFERFALHN
jgi:ferredoxin-NADP reductase